MSYQLVEDLQKKACPQVAVVQACRVLEVSRSGYYAHQTAVKQRLANPVVCAASVHLKAAFAASHKAYGSRRLRTAMAKGGIAIGRHRVRTLMRLNCLRPVWRRKFIHTTDSKHTMAVSPNVLNRQFEQTQPNQACGGQVISDSSISFFDAD
jgi:putative transposase